MSSDTLLRDRRADLAVLVNGFPRLSETFVLQELLDLERRGLRLCVLALSDPGEAVTQEDLARLQATVEYLPDKRLIGRRGRMRAHATLIRTRGMRHLAALAATARSADWTPGTLRRSAVLAQRLVELGSPPLYIHFAHKPGTIGRFAAALAGVRYAISCHAKDIWLTPPEELGPKLRDAEVVLTCTREGRAELERNAAGVTPVKLAYHGVDIEAAVPRVAVSGPPRLLSVGRLVPKKGYDTLIQATALLRDRNIPFALRIAGEGAEWARLQRLVHKLELASHITFLGPLSPGELRAEWERASVFAFGGRRLSNGDRDGLPNVVLEAMMNGLPVVSTYMPGVAEAVQDGRTGLLVRPEDPEAFADALERVLTEPGLAPALGERAQILVQERFDRRRLLPRVAEALVEAGLISSPLPPSPMIGAPVRELAGA